ncbi:hypothetical protein [Candidatus Poriferisodalis sp.]
MMIPGTNIPDPTATPTQVVTGYVTEPVVERIVEVSHKWWCRNG